MLNKPKGPTVIHFCFRILSASSFWDQVKKFLKDTEHYVLPFGKSGYWGQGTPSEQRRAHLDEHNGLA